MNPQSSRRLLLVVLDGWGIAPPGQGNAIASAHTPTMDSLWVSYPHTQIGASGESVGLPRGEVGNTETGHLNLGAGRIVYQDLARINISIADGSFFENQAFNEAIAHVKAHGSKLHIMGLVGAGGVHSNLEHLFALIHLASKSEVGKQLFLHLFTDGRDSPPTASKAYIDAINRVIEKEKAGFIASVMGRYWAMDRDRRWDRTAKAYYALTKGEGHLVKTANEAVDLSYQRGATDEFIEPSLVSGSDGKPIGLISGNDAVIFFNFRIDRPRQLSRAFVLQNFESSANVSEFDPYAVDYTKKHTLDTVPSNPVFSRGERIDNLFFVTMTEYEKNLVNAGAHVAFPPQSVTMPMGHVISSNGLRQLRATESEKERFVTFYFNGQREMPFEGEERLIISSPKVGTYDLKPEMSSKELTDAVCERMADEQFSFILLNFPNADMVGHTGNIQASVKGVEAVDVCLKKIVGLAENLGIAVVITADHGNAEEMLQRDSGGPNTEHSANQVPLVIVDSRFRSKPFHMPQGVLADVAPTCLSLIGLPIPSAMTGRNLLQGMR